MASVRFGFCELSLVPVRISPAHNAEMVSQLLFGEVFKVTDQTDTWIKVIINSDDYSGWIHKKQYLPISKKTFEEIRNSPNRKIVNEMQGAIRSVSNGIVYAVPYGSLLTNLKSGKFSIEGKQFVYSGKSIKVPHKANGQNLIKDALQFLHAPYLWGGKSEYGIDCSGFSQLVFSVNGIALPRDAYQQAEMGKPLEFIEQTKTGDLAFFNNEAGKIIHVGILISSSKIIHASGCLRIDKFDLKGIWNEEEKKYSHRLRVIKRIF